MWNYWKKKYGYKCVEFTLLVPLLFRRRGQIHASVECQRLCYAFAALNPRFTISLPLRLHTCGFESIVFAHKHLAILFMRAQFYSFFSESRVENRTQPFFIPAFMLRGSLQYQLALAISIQRHTDSMWCHGSEAFLKLQKSS